MAITFEPKTIAIEGTVITIMGLASAVDFAADRAG